MTTMPMANLGLTPSLVTSLAARDITEAFDIQAKTIPPALEGRDVCGRAPTGSGKTLAFGIPVVERVGKAKPRHPKALILTPTRELAAQIGDELKLIIGNRRITVATFYGGVGFGPQLSALRRGVDIAVACPGRLADLVRRGDVVLDEVEIAVLDEADRMADMGFLPEVRRLLDAVRPDRQTLLFSATLDGDIDILVRNYQRNPVRCEVEARADHVDRTTHTFLPVSRDQRTNTAAALAVEHGTTVVFTRTKRGADRVARQLSNAGLSSVAIHGGRSQKQRDRALADFSGGRAQVLVATDVAARGIHVDDVQCVIHYDLAGDHKDYVHRSGRTGRAGAQGTVVTLVTAEDSAQAASLQRDLGMAPARSVDRRGTGSRSGSGRPTSGGSGRPSSGRSATVGRGGSSGGNAGGGRSRRRRSR